MAMFWSKRANLDWIVVFLGNPGGQYENTRHNVGWMVADEVAGRKNVPIQRLKHKALTQTVELEGKRVLLMKPVTYMNLSGEAAGEAARFYKVPAQRVLVVCDDVSLPVGKLRFRKSGSAGGHNGLKSIEAHLGTQDYPRLKVGVGQKPHPEYDMVDWVLGKFSGEDKKVMEDAVKRAADGVMWAVGRGVDEAMSRFN